MQHQAGWPPSCHQSVSSPRFSLPVWNWSHRKWIGALVAGVRETPRCFVLGRGCEPAPSPGSWRKLTASFPPTWGWKRRERGARWQGQIFGKRLREKELGISTASSGTLFSTTCPQEKMKGEICVCPPGRRHRYIRTWQRPGEVTNKNQFPWHFISFDGVFWSISWRYPDGILAFAFDYFHSFGGEDHINTYWATSINPMDPSHTSDPSVSPPPLCEFYRTIWLLREEDEKAIKIDSWFSGLTLIMACPALRETNPFSWKL